MIDEAHTPFDDDDDSKTPVTPVLRPLTHAERQAAYGRFDWEPAPRGGDPEAIRILGTWQRENIVSVRVPQLLRLPARVHNACTAWVHKRVTVEFLNLWAAWELAGLLPLVLTYDGAFCARFKRGRAGGPHDDHALSNHSWGTAFDVNARYNRMGHVPLGVGEPGSTRELVPIAHEHGYVWGGNFAMPYTDGMHFEIGKRVA